MTAPSPAEADLLRHLAEIRDRMIIRGDYVTNEWADVADATTIADAITLLVERDSLRALLIELTDIEGPLPGTAVWAQKVRLALSSSTAGEDK